MGYSLVELVLVESYWCRRNGGGEWELESVERATHRQVDVFDRVE